MLAGTGGWYKSLLRGEIPMANHGKTPKGVSVSEKIRLPRGAIRKERLSHHRVRSVSPLPPIY